MVDYLDTSAFVKLVRAEPESSALRIALGSGAELVSSALIVVEGRRASARYGALAIDRAQLALTGLTLLPVDGAVLDAAAALEPPELRSLDAIHLATAISLSGELGHLFCYDRRLSAAASSAGLDVRSPGRS